MLSNLVLGQCPMRTALHPAPPGIASHSTEGRRSDPNRTGTEPLAREEGGEGSGGGGWWWGGGGRGCPSTRRTFTWKVSVAVTMEHRRTSLRMLHACNIIAAPRPRQASRCGGHMPHASQRRIKLSHCTHEPAARSVTAQRGSVAEGVSAPLTHDARLELVELGEGSRGGKGTEGGMPCVTHTVKKIRKFTTIH